eukprot:gnl/TRDRNA2_/TRDRNA2_177867_c1_seq10.p1 gnl/TRDRNA2_/TRDRNA2_177867_c1~~gnl/TRDRNA2_/TRDRNA2_177867_c1_seq10.p1  ORF type:complete len:819 (+),score=187.42 gnl/TRDRNA2_/TRDRNA2_177867_c1_seq10:81-2537(+)
MVSLAAAASAAAAGGTLFEYNRKNFMYDRKQRQEAEYQIMDFRMKQADLWREDVRDILGLTQVKMDTYLVVNAVQLGFCVMAFCEGRLSTEAPGWLIGCHTLSLAGAFMYLLMSVWLAMHASVAAKSYEVRILTQLVRLPVPSASALEGARTYASSFEKVESKQMFRVPFAQGKQQQVKESDVPVEATEGEATEGASATADPWGLERRGDQIYELDGSVMCDPKDMRHVKLVREAMTNWQAYDAFARISMTIGTNQLVTTLAYYVLGYVLIMNHGVIAAWCSCALFMAITAALIRLDMSLTAWEYKMSLVLIISGPILACIAAEQYAKKTPAGLENAKLLMPIAYAMHATWLLFLLYVSKITQRKDGSQLPSGFGSVLFLDVFGWVQRTVRGHFETGTVGAPQEIQRRRAGAGPAVQSIRYVDGRPVPTRPEDGAREQGADAGQIEASFVPEEDDLDLEPPAYQSAGTTPWRVFCGATLLMAVLWWATGAVVLLQSLGFDTLDVKPLLQQYLNDKPMQDEMPSLVGGAPLYTSWPHANVRPSSLACDSISGKVVSSSKFGLYMAELNDEVAKPHVSFTAAPLCNDLEGEALQDVALSCSAGDASSCKALVLHRQGRRVASCSISGHADGAALNAKHESAVGVADAWLGDSDMTTGSLQEEVRSISLAQECKNGGHGCAYLSTGSRLVEVQKGANERDGELDWYPTRVLQDKTGRNPSRDGDSLHLIGNRFLAMLQAGKKTIDVVDPKQGGILVGQWKLPEDKQWSSVCSAGSSIYLLQKGPSPELWKFPMPEELKPGSASFVDKRQALPGGETVAHMK